MRRALAALALASPLVWIGSMATAQPIRPGDRPGLEPRDRLPMKGSDLPPFGRGLPRTPDPAVRPGQWLGELPAVDEAFLKELVATRSYRLGRPTQLRFTPDGSQVLFLRAEARSPSLKLHAYDVATRKTREVVTHEALLGGGAETISPEERARRERLRLLDTGITSYAIARGGKAVLVAFAGRAFWVDLATGAPRELAGPDAQGQPVFDPRLSPDGTWLGFVRAGELWVAPTAGGAARQLTRGATETRVHAQAEFVAQEEMGRTEGWWWSSDARQLIVEEYDASKVETLGIADPANPAAGATTLRYPRAGRANVDVKLMLVPRTGGRSVEIAWDHVRYPYVADVAWEAGGPATVLVQTRDQREVVLLAVQPDGKTRPLVTEKDEAWVNLDVYALEHDRRDVLPSLDRERAWLPDGSGFLWATERGGAWQLELRGREGSLLRALTTPAQGFRGLRAFSSDRRAVHVVLGRSPLEQEVWSIPLDGGAARPLAGGPGLVDATFAADSAAHAVTRWGWNRDYGVDVVDATGAVVGALPTVAAPAPFVPRVEVLELPGPPRLTATVVKPRKPGARRLPVLVDVYGGPGTTFAPVARWRLLLDQWIADHGFVVVRIDGRGTPLRDRAHERAIRGKLGDVPLEDQIAGLRALGARDPSLDLARVGITGHSFGGYLSALAAIARPDVFDAAVAAAPVSEWRDYDTHYTERYLGVPASDADPVYAANGLLGRAGALARPLLIVHGTADDNVHLAHTLKLGDALVRAGKRPELLLLAGETHAFRDPQLLLRYYQRVFAFFREHLR